MLMSHDKPYYNPPSGDITHGAAPPDVCGINPAPSPRSGLNHRHVRINVILAFGSYVTVTTLLERPSHGL